MTTAQTATEAAVMATARSMETRTAPATRPNAPPPTARVSTLPGVSWTVGRLKAGAAGTEAGA